jgi:hypothetical protein
LLLYCRHSRDLREQQFFREATGRDISYQPVGSTYIRTNALESALRSYAVDLDVLIVNALIESPTELERIHTSAICFIAADGAHSRMRKELLGEEDIIKKDLQNVIEIKYEARGDSRALNFLKEGYKTQKIQLFMTFEYVGRTKDGVTPITLRIFVDKETFDNVPEATFKAPLSIQDERLPEKLITDINSYLNVRRELTGEEFIPGSGKLTKLVLSKYRAKKIAINRSGHPWFFVGDAAMGFPYFRALNCGLLCSSLLGRICSRLFNESNTPAFAILYYNLLGRMRYFTETTLAMTKDNILKAIDNYRKLSAAVPWETVKWTDEETFKYRTQEHYAFEEE